MAETDEQIGLIKCDFIGDSLVKIFILVEFKIH